MEAKVVAGFAVGTHSLLHKHTEHFVLYARVLMVMANGKFNVLLSFVFFLLRPRNPRGSGQNADTDALAAKAGRSESHVYLCRAGAKTWLIIKIYWTCEIAFMRA